MELRQINTFVRAAQMNESVIEGQSKPLLIYGKPEAQQASGE